MEQKKSRVIQIHGHDDNDLHKKLNKLIQNGMTISNIQMAKNMCSILVKETTEETINNQINEFVLEEGPNDDGPIFVSVIDDIQRELIAELIEGRALYFERMISSKEYKKDMLKNRKMANIYWALLKRFEA